MTSLLNLLVTRAPRSVNFVEIVCLKLKIASGLKLTSATTPDNTLLMLITAVSVSAESSLDLWMGLTRHQITAGKTPDARAQAESPEARCLSISQLNDSSDTPGRV